MNPICKVLFAAGVLIPFASGSAKADFVLEVDGQSGTAFTAQIESNVGGSVERTEIAGTVPARYVFDARGVRVRMITEPESDGRIRAVLLHDGREVSQASGSGSGATLMLQSGAGLPADDTWTAESSGGWGGGYGGWWSGGSSGGGGGGGGSGGGWGGGGGSGGGWGGGGSSD